jgi:hypothetical protein
MAELLNSTVINTDEPLPGCPIDEDEMVYRPWLRLRHRELLDERFGDLLRPGNLVELRDGLHSAGTIANQISDMWTGIIDLAMCFSTSPATIIKSGRTGRRVISSNKQVIPEIRLRIIRDLYRKLVDTEVNYASELVFMVRNLREMTNLVRQSLLTKD